MILGTETQQQIKKQTNRCFYAIKYKNDTELKTKLLIKYKLIKVLIAKTTTKTK